MGTHRRAECVPSPCVRCVRAKRFVTMEIKSRCGAIPADGIRGGRARSVLEARSSIGVSRIREAGIGFVEKRAMNAWCSISFLALLGWPVGTRRPTRHGDLSRNSTRYARHANLKHRSAIAFERLLSFVIEKSKELRGLRSRKEKAFFGASMSRRVGVETRLWGDSRRSRTSRRDFVSSPMRRWP